MARSLSVFDGTVLYIDEPGNTAEWMSVDGDLLPSVASETFSAPAASEASAEIQDTGVETGTSGNDTFVVTTSTTEIDGNGGDDVAVFEDVPNSFFDWYRITATSDGGLNVQDVHATGQLVHVVGVETLTFNDGTYNTGTGVFTPTTTSPGSQSPSPPSGSHQLVATAVPEASGQKDVVGLVLQNNTDAKEAAGYVTFAEVFAKGAVRPGTVLMADLGGHEVAVQMDVKSTNSDGSVRQAILTFQAPAIAAGGDTSVMLVKSSGTSPLAAKAAITPQDILSGGYDTTVNVTIHNSDGSTTQKSIDAASVLQKAISDGTVTTWLKGPLAGEYDVTANVASNLSVTFDIREDANGVTHTNISFARDQAYTTDVSTLNYDVSIAQGGKTVFSHDGVQQYAFSTWSTEVDSHSAIAPQVVYDMQYLIKTGAIPAYELSTGVSSASVQSEIQTLSGENTGPLGNAMITQYMPETGGRPDIGENPTWVADYLVSQSPDALAAMLLNANAAGGVPWHLMDGDQPVNVNKHPLLWVDSRGEGSQYGSDALPVTFSTAASGYSLDTAHQPDLSYVPYLLSGNQQYLDDLKDQAAYIVASWNPGYRGATDDLIPDGAQVRAKAWDLRDIGNAAYALPDSDPMKKYFMQVINHNLQHIIDTYVKGAAGASEGQLKGWIEGDYLTGIMAPWQQDMFAIVMNELGEMGFKKADTILKWENNFLSGRFLNGDNGFNPNEGLAYNLQVGDTNTGTNYTTWQKVYSESFGNTEPDTLQGDTVNATGYAAYARAGLASDISGTESPSAIEAYAWLVSQTPSVTKAFASDPSWDIVPRLADGQYLTSNLVQVAAAGGQKLTAGNHDSMLIGGGGNDTLTGGRGIDILYGGAGGDTLRGEAGNDYIFAGKGGSTITGGSGADYLQAGNGHDTFVYKSAGASTGTHYDTISGFDFGKDLLSVPGHVVHIDAEVASGDLSSDGFNSELVHAINAGHLGAHDAVLFTPDSGSLAGETFLVVDLNGKAGYQAGQDLVVHLEDAAGHLDVSDFI